MAFELDEAMGYIIETTEQALKRGLRRRFRQNGYEITPYQWVILYRLWNQQGLNQTELADISLRDRPTVTRILDVMERNGLVVRKSDADDRRSYKVYLTQRGEELQDHLPPIVTDYLDSFTEGISQEEMEIAKRVLLRIRENANQELMAAAQRI